MAESKEENDAVAAALAPIERLADKWQAEAYHYLIAEPIHFRHLSEVIKEHVFRLRVALTESRNSNSINKE